MIAWLRGRLLKKGVETVVVDVGGVGYRVFVSQRLLDKLPALGEQVTLEVHTAVKEDAIHLYGFASPDEREAFEALISMNGVGPRIAIGVLSGIEARELARAVCGGDVARLCLVPGVGKKKAERMVVELKERLLPLARLAGAESGAANTLDELRSALSNLGFRAGEIERAIGALRTEELVEGSLERLLPQTLKLLRG